MVALSLQLTPRERMQLELLEPPARRDYDYWSRELGPLLRQSRGIERRLREIATQLGQPFSTVRKRYYRAKVLGPLGFVDRRLAGPLFWKRKKRSATTPVSKCKALQELFKKLCEEQNRSSRWAHEELVRRWKNRDASIRDIPELADFPGWPKLPSGWTYDNLMRYGPTALELDSARHGQQLAKRHRSTVYTTRAGLYVGSHYMLDDKWNDFFVNTFSAKGGAHGRPLEVYSMDLFSALRRRYATRVRTWDADKKQYAGVAAVMARFVYAATLYLDGYHPRKGTEWILEHGTGALPEAILDKVYEATGGRVTYSLSGMTGDPIHTGQYPGLRRGNPQHKPALESNNNLEHNALGALAGQTGRNVEERPEQLAGLLDHNQKLLDVWPLLSEAKRALLQFPLLELNQYLDLAEEAYAAIASTRNHELEGWVESGNVVQCYQWGAAELLEHQLDAKQRAAIPAMLEAGLLSAKPVRMTRQEVWHRGHGELERIPGWLVCTILGDDLAREARITSSEFAIRDNEIGPGVYRYEPLITTADGRTEVLRDGETYQVFINPFALGTLFVRDARGRYLGEAKQIYVPCRADHDGVKRAMGASVAREEALLRDFKRRHGDQGAAKQARHEHNAEVIASEDPATPLPRRQSAAQDIKKSNRAAQLAALGAAAHANADE